MMRVIGNFVLRQPKNNRVRGFLDWLRPFEGCIFTAEDWKHFKDCVRDRMDYYNSGIKENGYRIEVSFHKNQISVTCVNGNRGEWFSQLFITVIPVKSEYNRTLGEAVEYDSPVGGSEEEGDDD